MSDRRWRATVVVMPKEGVSDPQGEAVRGGIGLLGISGVERVRVGRNLEIELSAPNQTAAEKAVHTMSEKLLANLVIEQYRIGEIGEVAVGTSDS